MTAPWLGPMLSEADVRVAPLLQVDEPGIGIVDHHHAGEKIFGRQPLPFMVRWQISTPTLCSANAPTATVLGLTAQGPLLAC